LQRSIRRQRRHKRAAIDRLTVELPPSGTPPRTVNGTKPAARCRSTWYLPSKCGCSVGAADRTEQTCPTARLRGQVHHQLPAPPLSCRPRELRHAEHRTAPPARSDSASVISRQTPRPVQPARRGLPGLRVNAPVSRRQQHARRFPLAGGPGQQNWRMYLCPRREASAVSHHMDGAAC
jgi:hypothetical protein